jgi:hypothetical protein
MQGSIAFGLSAALQQLTLAAARRGKLPRLSALRMQVRRGRGSRHQQRREDGGIGEPPPHRSRPVANAVFALTKQRLCTLLRLVWCLQ